MGHGSGWVIDRVENTKSVHNAVSPVLKLASRNWKKRFGPANNIMTTPSNGEGSGLIKTNATGLG